jgi:hypothetical protein
VALRGQRWIRELRGSASARKLRRMADPLIDRPEVVALLFNVSDIVATLKKIQRLLEENDGEEADEG